MIETVPMFADLPVYQDDLDRIKAKKKRVNALQEMLIELMNGDLDENGKLVPGGRKPTSLADVQKGTNIAWGTLHGWYKGDVSAQLADENLLKLAQFFNVSLEYLCFGIGDDSKAFEKFEPVKAENNNK